MWHLSLVVGRSRTRESSRRMAGVLAPPGPQNGASWQLRLGPSPRSPTIHTYEHGLLPTVVPRRRPLGPGPTNERMTAETETGGTHGREAARTRLLEATIRTVQE